MTRSGSGDGPVHQPAGLEVTLLELVLDRDHSGVSGAAGWDDVLTGARSTPTLLSRLMGGLRGRWLAAAPRRRRLVWGAGFLAVLAIVGAALIVTRPSGSAAVASRPSSSYDPNVDAGGALGAALAVDGGDVIDVSVASGAIYVASHDRLSVVDPTSHKVLRSAEVTSKTDGHLVLDAAANTVWDIDLGSWPTQLREFAHDTLRLTRSLVVAGIVWDAVVLDGRLYLATSTGVAMVAPGSSTLTPVTASDSAPQALTVDPAAHAVLALAPGSNGQIVTISDGGNTLQTGSALNVSSPTIASVDGALWAGGINPDARLLRIDPRTLRPLPESAGGEMVAEGSDNELRAIPGSADLWIFNRTGQRLLCADGRTGEVLQTWNGITQAVSTGGHDPYVVTQGQARPLVLRGRCTG